MRFFHPCAVLPIFVAFAPASAFAAVHVLLIGVSGYPALPEHLRLQGPANDVRLMRAALIKTGVSPDHIHVVADQVDGANALPTRANILRAFATTSKTIHAGDWVILYLSGHGSRQPQWGVRNGYGEPDGLDEIFLPYDITAWDGKQGLVKGAIVDHEIGAALETFRRRGANVWTIFDTCHAAGMTKAMTFGEETPVLRYISPATLGVPDDLLRVASNKPQPSDSSAKAFTSKAPHTVAVAAAKNRINFYASQSDEPSAEELLLDPMATPPVKRRFGLFTHLIAGALPQWRGSFRQLSERIRLAYKNRPYPSPRFEGDLDVESPLHGALTTGSHSRLPE